MSNTLSSILKGNHVLLTGGTGGLGLGVTPTVLAHKPALDMRGAVVPVYGNI